MTKQLKFTCLLLLVASGIFAQTPKTSDKQIKSDPKIVFPPNAKVSAKEALTVSNVIPGIGVVVKKNPGGGAGKVGTTNEKGEVELTIPEKGDYTLTLTGGATASTNNNAAARSVNSPVQGVRVGVGKNPPGEVTNFATTNDKGEVEFNGLEAGVYKVRVVEIKKGQSN